MGSAGKKRRPAEPGIGCGSCRGLSLTHLTLFLPCSHERGLTQAAGEGVLQEGDVFRRWLYNAAPPQACPAPACEEAAARAGESRGPSLGPTARAGPSHWEQPPTPPPRFTRRSFQLWLSHSCCSSFSPCFGWKFSMETHAGPGRGLG